METKLRVITEFVDEVLPVSPDDAAESEDGDAREVEGDGLHEYSDGLRRRWTKHVQSLLRYSSVAIPASPQSADTKRDNGARKSSLHV